LIYIKRNPKAKISPALVASTIDVTMPDTWYVTFQVHQRGTLPRPRCPRLTATFATEAEARHFARARLEEGLTVFAGTINPHTPRRVILAEHINNWLAVE
jgi:hypothetical protein